MKNKNLFIHNLEYKIFRKMTEIKKTPIRVFFISCYLYNKFLINIKMKLFN